MFKNAWDWDELLMQTYTPTHMKFTKESKWSLSLYIIFAELATFCSSALWKYFILHKMVENNQEK